MGDFTNKFQSDVHGLVSHYEEPYFPPTKITAKITEELGEVAKEIIALEESVAEDEKHIYNKKLGSKIADLLFATMCLANSHGVNIDEAWGKMMQQRYARYNDEFPKKE